MSTCERCGEEDCEAEWGRKEALACRDRELTLLRQKLAATEAKLVDAERRELAEAELYQQARVEELKARQKLGEAERECRAWRALAKWGAMSCQRWQLPYRSSTGSWCSNALVSREPVAYGTSDSPQGAAVALAEKLGLLEKDGG